MTMNLFKLFSCNVEIQYKGVLAYFAHFYEQPKVHFTYDYLLVAETEDSSRPVVCGGGESLDEEIFSAKEYCADMQVQEYDNNRDGLNDYIDFKIHLIVPPDDTLSSVLLILGLDYQLKTVCPLRMQSLAVIAQEFAIPPSGFRYFGDLNLHQTTHLECPSIGVDARFNTSLFDGLERGAIFNFVVNPILETYFRREVTTRMTTAFSRNNNGHTGTMDMEFSLRLPQAQVLYVPSLMQELKWAWPQYLALYLVFYWIFDKIKMFVFKNRLLMAWEVVPWRK